MMLVKKDIGGKREASFWWVHHQLRCMSILWEFESWKNRVGELGSVWVGAWKGGLAVGRVRGQPHRRPLESWSTDWAALVSPAAGTQCPTRNMGVAHRLLTRLCIQLWILTSTVEVLLLTFTMSWERWERFMALAKYCDQFEMVPALRLSCLWERDSPPWERVGSRWDGALIGGELSKHFLSSLTSDREI